MRNHPRYLHRGPAGARNRAGKQVDRHDPSRSVRWAIFVRPAWPRRMRPVAAQGINPLSLLGYEVDTFSMAVLPFVGTK
jgi:hypothetical protein